MKKIFYSLMAAALCACSQSEVDDNMGTAPQPENNGLKFTVVDNGFIGEDGTRVTYGDYGTNEAYHATFEEGDAIGIFAIKTTESATGTTESPYTPADDAYVVKNAKLTLTGGIWKGSVDFQDADLLFAYAPYREGAEIPDPSYSYREGDPSFIGAKGSWDIDTDNNRFFVHPYYVTDNSEGNFEANDWMGAVANVNSDTKEVTFNMKHMRGMIELTTDINVTLEDLTLAVGGDNGDKYKFNPFHITTSTQNVYRILTTEYRSKNTVYATIKDMNIVKKYKKTLSDKSTGAGKCFCVNIGYVPPKTFTVSADKSLASILTEEYGSDYATNGKVTSLRLAGTLQGTSKDDGDWATLRSLTTLTTLDMYQLTNESIPDKLIWRDEGETMTKLCETLTTLVLPNNLKSIGNNSLQPKTQLTNIELPASVTTLANGAFWGSGSLSIRIPEDSQLQSIGHGAFQYVKAVYTDSNNVNVLKIPASVTSISDYAFANIATMGKVIFQSPEAPIFGGTNVFSSNNALIYVPDKAKYSGNFPGKTVIVGSILTTENYTSPYTITYDGQGLPALCDGNNATFWHTPWSGASEGDATYGQYIDITLPEGVTMTSLMVRYVTRSNNNAVPTTVDIYTNNGEDWVKLVALPKDGEELPTGGNASYITDKMTPAASFTKIRFAVTQAKGGSLCGPITTDANGYAVASTSLAELTIGEEIWIDSAAN